MHRVSWSIVFWCVTFGAFLTEEFIGNQSFSDRWYTATHLMRSLLDHGWWGYAILLTGYLWLGWHLFLHNPHVWPAP